MERRRLWRQPRQSTRGWLGGPTAWERCRSGRPGRLGPPDRCCRSAGGNRAATTPQRPMFLSGRARLVAARRATTTGGAFAFWRRGRPPTGDPAACRRRRRGASLGPGVRAPLPARHSPSARRRRRGLLVCSVAHVDDAKAPPLGRRPKCRRRPRGGVAADGGNGGGRPSVVPTGGGHGGGRRGGPRLRRGDAPDGHHQGAATSTAGTPVALPGDRSLCDPVGTRPRYVRRGGGRESAMGASCL